jgi:hypothetical protein
MSQVFISYRHVKPDEDLAAALGTSLTARGLSVFLDSRMQVGTDWVNEIERQLRASQFFVVLLSQESIRSPMLRQEVEFAHSLKQAGVLRILPVRVAFKAELPYDLASYLNPIQYTEWNPDLGFSKISEEIFGVIKGAAGRLHHEQVREPSPEGLRLLAETTERAGAPLPAADPRFETGALPLDSPFYVRRDADSDVENLVLTKGSTAIVKGPRQVGKSSLLARALRHAMRSGRPGVYIDFQLIDERHFKSLGSVFWHVASRISRALQTKAKPSDIWNRDDDAVGEKEGVSDFIQEAVLNEISEPVVFVFDEVDRLFGRDYRDDFFATLRGWHNYRAIHDAWRKLNLVVAHATDPALWIRDLNQSPFNVGERFHLQDFTASQVRDLNARHGRPLRNEDEIEALIGLVGGNPYLIRHALYLTSTGKATFQDLTRLTDDEHGPFGDHLRSRIWALRHSPKLKLAITMVIRHGACPDEDDFQSLLAGGLIRGDVRDRCEMRCELYRRYFQTHL